MPRLTYDEIAELVKKEYPKFTVSLPEEADECMTVYPPESYYCEEGVDVFLEGNTAEFWMDGYREGTLRSIQDVSVVTAAIIAVLEKIQAERAKEFAE